VCNSDVGKYMKYFNTATDTWKLMRCAKWCYGRWSGLWRRRAWRQLLSKFSL